MEEYTLYFEIYGKKMKTKVFAESESEAKQKIIDKITWHKVESQRNPTVDKLLSIFNMS